MLHTPDFDFSFSGLKTAVLYYVRDQGGIEKISEAHRAEIALEFENAAIEVLVKKTIAAAKKHKALGIIVGGGVAANKHLHTELTSAAKKNNLTILFPSKALSTDNAVMIGIAGYYGKTVSYTSKKLIAQGNMPL
jgi:N6-L-threonylcarbamoyladenine synthase